MQPRNRPQGDLSSAPFPSSSAVCPTHGLRFDPSVSSGCIRCRASSAAPPSAPTSRRALLLGAAAIATTGGALATYAYGPWKPGTPGDLLQEIAYAPGHRGALFVPASITPSTPSPFILLLDPSGDARSIVSRYASAAAAHGWIAASSFEVADGTSDDADTETLLSLHDYVRGRYALDEARTFAGGMSGGGCGAYRLALVKPGVVRGAIVECGHMRNWREVGALAEPSLRFYLFTRNNDFNRPATAQLCEAMEGKGCRVTMVEREGAHNGMAPAEVSEALEWMAAG